MPSGFNVFLLFLLLIPACTSYFSEWGLGGSALDCAWWATRFSEPEMFWFSGWGWYITFSIFSLGLLFVYKTGYDLFWWLSGWVKVFIAVLFVCPLFLYDESPMSLNIILTSPVEPVFNVYNVFWELWVAKSLPLLLDVTREFEARKRPFRTGYSVSGPACGCLLRLYAYRACCAADAAPADCVTTPSPAPVVAALLPLLEEIAPPPWFCC